MLKIGDFSMLAQISIYMLRHYNEIGLLIPAHVDECTGYRYYTEEQLPVANRIQALKDMGFGLAAIRDILNEYKNDRSLKRYLTIQTAQAGHFLSRSISRKKYFISVEPSIMAS